MHTVIALHAPTMKAYSPPEKYLQRYTFILPQT